MLEEHSSKKGKTYVCLVFSTMVDKTLCEKNIHEGNETWGPKMQDQTL